MPRQYFTIPSVTELPLFGGEDGVWIQVKDELTYGEQQMLASASMTSIHVNANNVDGDTEVGLDMKRHSILRLATWIVDWNLPDHTGKTLDVTRQNIENLRPDIAEEINRVLTEHIAAREKKEPVMKMLTLEPETNS